MNKSRGLRIRKRMDELDIGIRHITASLYVTEKTVYNWMNGHNIMWKHLTRLAEILKVTPSWIRNGKEGNNNGK